MKAQTQHPQIKATKTFRSKKVLRKERKRLLVNATKYILKLVQKNFDGEMQISAGGIGKPVIQISE